MYMYLYINLHFTCVHIHHVYDYTLCLRRCCRPYGNSTAIGDAMQRSFGAADDVTGIDEEEEEEEENDDEEEASSEDELTEEQVEQYKNLVLESRYSMSAHQPAEFCFFRVVIVCFHIHAYQVMYLHLCVSAGKPTSAASWTRPSVSSPTRSTSTPRTRKCCATLRNSATNSSSLLLPTLAATDTARLLARGALQLLHLYTNC